MQNDYALFGDFVSFDTTYRTNHDHRPLRAFLEVNHHREQVVFGACLLYDEIAQTFKWLFETFVECIEGKSPQSFFTDQDDDMLAAIPTALPNTHHFLCVWHMNQNTVKNFGPLFGNKDFKKDWDKLLFDSDVDDFDLTWSKMIEDHNLQDKQWLQKIYEKHEKCAPTHVRNVFCAGKRTTQLSESFNAKLRKYLKTIMNMARFFQQFQRVIDDMWYKELRSNFEMLDKLPILQTDDPLCIHASKVYTPSILNLFVEQAKKVYCIALNCRRETTRSEEVVVHMCSPEPTHNCSTVKRYVITTTNGFHQCSCKYFNFVGVICCHIMWLLKQGRVIFFIPDEYILRRWTRKARMAIAPESTSNVGADPDLERTTSRRKIMSLYSSTIWKYRNYPVSWEVFQCYHTGLANELAQLTLTTELGEIRKAVDATKVNGALAVVAKGFKTREPKH